jgi:alpha-beta hydrolase superfamily lysophospholipase
MVNRIIINQLIHYKTPDFIISNDSWLIIPIGYIITPVKQSAEDKVSMSKHLEGFLETTHDEKIYIQSWHPDTKTDAGVVVVHGLCEHSGRYEPLAHYLNSSGFSVFGLDLIGHGKSGGTRAHVSSFGDYTELYLDYINQIKEQYSGLPLFLFGHSMGGQLALELLFEAQVVFQAAVISAPNILVPDYVSPLTIQLGALLSRLSPQLRILALDSNGVSSIPEEVERYNNDPLVFNGKISARLASEINRSMKNIAQLGANIKLPVQIIHGEQDPLVSPKASQYLFDLISSKEKDLIFFPDAYHEILRENIRQDVMESIQNWFQRFLPDS